MSTKANEYNKLDFSKISFANEVISMSEALKNVTPSPSISKIEINKAEKDYTNKCVKLEISY